MQLRNENYPELEEVEQKILEEQKARWVIEAPIRPDVRGIAKLKSGEIEAEWYCPQNLPVICVVLKVHGRCECSEELRELGVLTILLESGCWAEQRVVVLKRDSEPSWCETEIFVRDMNAKDPVSRWRWTDADYENEKESKRHLVERLIPHDFRVRASIFPIGDFVHEMSRYDCLSSLIGTTLGQTAKVFLPKEWIVKDDKMRHLSGFEVTVPSALPAKFAVRAEIPEDVIHLKTQKRVLAAVLRLCSERASALDFDRPYQTLIKVVDNPEASIYFEKPSDWAMFCKHLEGWLTCFRNRAS